MTTITNPEVGAQIFTHKGNAGIIEALEDERVIIRATDGSLKRIPLTAIARWELPAVPKPIQMGDRVRHMQTAQVFSVVELYDHFMGWQDGDRTYEQWAKLTTDDGKFAHWKVQQLEPLP